jgi:hypothetical protein
VPSPWPSGSDAFTTRVDDPTSLPGDPYAIYAAHINALQNAVAALEANAVDTSTNQSINGGKTFDQPISVTATGASAGGGLGGATTSGPPLSGAWTAGQAVIDHTGTIWVCTASGTPGTWYSLANSTASFRKMQLVGSTNVTTTGSWVSVASGTSVFTPPFAYTLVCRFSGVLGSPTATAAANLRFSSGGTDISLYDNNHTGITTALQFGVTELGKKQFAANRRAGGRPGLLLAPPHALRHRPLRRRSLRL